MKDLQKVKNYLSVFSHVLLAIMFENNCMQRLLMSVPVYSALINPPYWWFRRILFNFRVVTALDFVVFYTFKTEILEIRQLPDDEWTERQWNVVMLDTLGQL